MQIRNISILDKVLIRWGIQTTNYKKYLKSMQKALDFEKVKRGTMSQEAFYINHKI